jgi:hypothetical protein
MAPFRAESVLIVTYDKVVVEGETTVCVVRTSSACVYAHFSRPRVN